MIAGPRCVLQAPGVGKKALISGSSSRQIRRAAWNRANRTRDAPLAGPAGCRACRALGDDGPCCADGDRVCCADGDRAGRAHGKRAHRATRVAVGAATGVAAGMAAGGAAGRGRGGAGRRRRADERVAAGRRTAERAAGRGGAPAAPGRRSVGGYRSYAGIAVAQRQRAAVAECERAHSDDDRAARPAARTGLVRLVGPVGHLDRAQPFSCGHLTVGTNSVRPARRRPGAGGPAGRAAAHRTSR